MAREKLRDMVTRAVNKRGITLDEPAWSILCEVITEGRSSGGIIEVQIANGEVAAYRIDARRALAATLATASAVQAPAIGALLAIFAFIADVGSISVEMPSEAAELLFWLYAIGDASIGSCEDYLIARGADAAKARDVIDGLEVLRVITLTRQQVILNETIYVRPRGPLRFI